MFVPESTASAADLPTSPVPPGAAPLRLRGHQFSSAAPGVMAIINRTRDSFWGGNRHADLDSAMSALHSAVELGVDIVDVGGVRAGQEGEVVTAQMEVERVVPFLEQARTAYPELVLSLDTWRAEVADAAGPYIDLVNDTWQGADPELVHVAAGLGAGLVVSHSGGLAPRTDPRGVTYPPEPDGVRADVLRVLGKGAARAQAAGIPRERILLDPTLDFGKTTRHSLTLLRHSAETVALGYPVMQALSRKDFIGETLDLEADDRLEGTLASTAVAAWLGVAVFRAHDVRATRRVLDMVASIRGDRPPAKSLRGTIGADETPVGD
ncbi:dihydropteroate synthase [Nostocoides sp. F2B08]|nr:dihydropteroate synthase [Tetrasphaera sp. F2B08]